MQVKDMLNSRKTTSIHYYAIRGINEAVHLVRKLRNGNIAADVEERCKEMVYMFKKD